MTGEMTLGLMSGTSRKVPHKELSLRHSRIYEKAASDFRVFLDQIREWAIDNSSKVAKIYLIVGLEQTDIYVISRSIEYDFELRKLVSALILSLRDAGTPAFATLIPDGSKEELSAYFDVSKVLSLNIQ